MPDRNKICVIFIAQHLDEYRVIYKSNKEWLIDAPESSIFAARNRAEKCMKALYLQPACKKNSVRIYEVSIASHLYHEMLSGLHDFQAKWQDYMDTAANILNTKDNVSMVSLVSDNNEDGKHEPYLFVISNNMQTGQHFMDTIQLRQKTSCNDMGIVYKISEGKPRLYIDQPHRDNDASPLTIDLIPGHSAVGF